MGRGWWLVAPSRIEWGFMSATTLHIHSLLLF
jgi:hypothetical protein